MFGYQAKPTKKYDEHTACCTQALLLILLEVTVGRNITIVRFYKKLKNVSCEYNRLNG